MREFDDLQRQGERTRYCERATLLEKKLMVEDASVWPHCPHHSSEVSVDQKMLFIRTEGVGRDGRRRTSPPTGADRDSASACVGSVLGLDADTFRTVGALAQLAA
jgi:hypothetical protein